MDDLEPGVREFQRRTAADYARYAEESAASLAARRAVCERVREPWRQGGPAMAATQDLKVAGTRIRIHRPSAGVPLPVLVYLHGGGWTVFSIDTHERLMREYAARSGCAVVGVDYPLSPEARFPEALEAIVAVCEWVRSDGGEHGLRHGPLAIGGDSAGANLAVGTAMMLRDSGAGADALLLNYGAFDPDPRPSWEQFDREDDMLRASEMPEFWANYLGPDYMQVDDDRARPLLGDLSGLPPTYLCIAECDILRDENLELVDRLADFGIPVTANRYAGASHSFLEAVSVSPLADRALTEASAWLREQLRP